MFAGYITHVAEDSRPYRVFVQRDGDVIRIETAETRAEANRTLTDLIKAERAYEAELRWDAPERTFELEI